MTARTRSSRTEARLPACKAVPEGEDRRRMPRAARRHRQRMRPGPCAKLDSGAARRPTASLLLLRQGTARTRTSGPRGPTDVDAVRADLRDLADTPLPWAGSRSRSSAPPSAAAARRVAIAPECPAVNPAAATPEATGDMVRAPPQPSSQMASFATRLRGKSQHELTLSRPPTTCNDAGGLLLDRRNPDLRTSSPQAPRAWRHGDVSSRPAGISRPIVVKTVRHDHIHDGSFLARFLDGLASSRLNHQAWRRSRSRRRTRTASRTRSSVRRRSPLADVRHRAVQVGVRTAGRAVTRSRSRWPGARARPRAFELRRHAARHRAPRPLSAERDGRLRGRAEAHRLRHRARHNRRCHTVAGVVFAKPGYVAPEVAPPAGRRRPHRRSRDGRHAQELCAGKRLLNGDAQKHLEDVATGKFDIRLLAATYRHPDEARRDHPEAVQERS